MKYWPELLIAVVALFFTYRELGTFPGAWIDEGLFIMTGKYFLETGTYGIPLLDHVWEYPYFLAVGPTVIAPVALALKLFGLSIAAARIPMTLYILGTVALTYVFTRKLAGRAAALWATALLVTLSAFINTGKPVLGEIPGFFFMLLGLFVMERSRTTLRRGALSGILFGLAIVTKITLLIVLPALVVAWLVALMHRKWNDVVSIVISGLVAIIVYLPWRILEALHTPAGSLTEEISLFVFGGGDMPMFYVLRETPELLTRLPYLAFGVILMLGMMGIWARRLTISLTSRICITVIVTLFILYFLNSYGWYRHLLTAHLLLLPFVAVGLTSIAGKKLTAVLLSIIVLFQGAWQFSHRGSGFGTELAKAVEIVREEYAETDLLIEQPEVMAQLPSNPHWLFLIREGISPSMPEIFLTLNDEQRCMRRLRKLSQEEVRQYGNDAVPVGNYHIIPPPPGC